MIFWELLLFALGASGGSFLGVLISRYPQKGGLDLWGRSHCDNCNRQLAWWENIPLLSFLLLRGRCRTCGAKVNPEWFILELLGGLLFLATFVWWRQQNLAWPWLGMYLLLVWFLLAIFFFDAHYQIIPDVFLLSLLVLVLFLPRLDFLAAFGGLFFFLFLYLITGRKGMGLGDAKLVFVLGLWLGWQRLLFLFYLAFLAGGLWAGFLLWRRRAHWKTAVAFGPFLVAAALISWWWGDYILKLLPW